MQSKTCTKCGEEKPLSEFGNSKHAPKGKTYWCLQCKRDYAARYRITPSGIYHNIKNRTTFYKNHPFKISCKEFVDWYENESRLCHYCEIPEDKLFLWKKITNGRFRKLTVDCKNNDVGYIEDNLVLACDKCNLMKGDLLTYDEMLYVGQNFIKPKWEKLLD